MSVRAKKAGAREFLTKPFREQELIEAVQQALDHDRERCSRERITWLRCTFTVISLVPRSSAICLLRRPATESVPDLVRMAARLELPLRT